MLTTQLPLTEHGWRLNMPVSNNIVRLLKPVFMPQHVLIDYLCLFVGNKPFSLIFYQNHSVFTKTLYLQPLTKKT